MPQFIEGIRKIVIVKGFTSEYHPVYLKEADTYYPTVQLNHLTKKIAVSVANFSKRPGGNAVDGSRILSDSHFFTLKIQSLAISFLTSPHG